MRQVEDQRAHMRQPRLIAAPQRLPDQRADLGADAVKRRHRCKQRIKHGRAHRLVMLAGLAKIKADTVALGRYMPAHPLIGRFAAMIEPTDLEARRRRAKFRAWHRGMKEMDLLLGGYADAHVNQMDAEDLTTFEVLMEVLDRDLFKWFTGEGPVPAEYDTPLFRTICAYHQIELT